mmetsp:Transcript_26726/g.86307  ORF Transcript_26726/g.86307 Transcript_26726/m.86307 type:complete len:214 (+) Transcript_26726:337-978(+)|eukprot:scaffold4656_cov117-Isochrysis_galbana.AAC.20
MSVPTASSPKRCIRVQCRTRPSITTACSTPPWTASIAVWIFGIIPPEAVPSWISSWQRASVSFGMSMPCPSRTPDTSVSSRSWVAPRAAATAPAIVSALMLYASPSVPAPMGASTGVMPWASNECSTSARTATGSPTKPRSTSPCRFTAVTIRSSRPVRPSARPPAWQMEAAIFLLMEPASTISAISMVASSVTLRPPTKLDGMASFSSIAPI